MHHRPALVVTLVALLVAPVGLARAGADDSNRAPQFGWALVSKGSTLATSQDELDRLDDLPVADDRVLLARFGASAYLIRDAATLDRVDRLVEPIRRLGEQLRQVSATPEARRGDKVGRHEWKSRLRPLKERRGEYMRRVSPEIEDLAREAVRQGRALRVP